MTEVERTVDHLVVLARGRVVADAPITEVVASAGERVRLAAPDAAVVEVVARAGGAVTPDGDGCWLVDGLDAAAIGDLAAAAGLALHRLEPVRSSLEDVFATLTHEDPA